MIYAYITQIFIGGEIMPTFNQLVRTGRKSLEKKAKAPALLHGLNTKKNV